jgi:Protein of unknown function (DUF559)
LWRPSARVRCGRPGYFKNVMNGAKNTGAVCDPLAILDRHACRRAAGLATVSLLVGPIGAGARAWRRWANANGHAVIAATGNGFPTVEWAHSVAERVDLPATAVRCLARRVSHDLDQFLAAWRGKTPADCERIWSSVARQQNDDVLRPLSALGVDGVSGDTVAAAISGLGERIVPAIVQLGPVAAWPAVLFECGSAEEFAAVAHEAASWAERVPMIPVAIVAPAVLWAAYVVATPDSRVKAILREGELTVPVLDPDSAGRALAAVGVEPSTAALIVGDGADATLVESAAAAAQATAVPPLSQLEDDRARSAAERFLFEFLESLPETAGQFEQNAVLDFRFGPRPAEIDLLCRERRVAVEIDGYFHFLDATGYRRDRAKDWELQRRGYLVLRFLAGDVIPELAVIRDRILEALDYTATGVPP